MKGKEVYRWDNSPTSTQRRDLRAAMWCFVLGGLVFAALVALNDETVARVIDGWWAP